MKELLKFNYLTLFIVLLCFGINVVIFNVKLYKIIVIFILLYLILDAIGKIFKLIFKKKFNVINFAIKLITILLLIFMLNNFLIPLSIFPIILGLYIILNGFLKLILTFFLLINKDKTVIFNLMISIFQFFLGTTLLFSPIINLDKVLIIVGIYLILLSLNYLEDYFKDVYNINSKNNLKRKIRIPIPAVIEALMPYTFLKYINNILNENNFELLSINKTNTKPDVELLIHVTENGDGIVGHIDLCYKNKVMSYGNYDKSSRKLFDAIGDGVMIVANKKKYIKFCIKESQKTIFCYGLKLTNEQIIALEKKIDMLKENTYAWKPNLNIDSYGKKIYLEINAKLYKFKYGRLKNFYLLGNNCAYFTDTIVGATGSDILKINGVITPGAYQEYLDREFNKKNSMVISRHIYNSKNIK